MRQEASSKTQHHAAPFRFLPTSPDTLLFLGAKCKGARAPRAVKPGGAALVPPMPMSSGSSAANAQARARACACEQGSHPECNRSTLHDAGPSSAKSLTATTVFHFDSGVPWPNPGERVRGASRKTSREPNRGEEGGLYTISEAIRMLVHTKTPLKPPSRRGHLNESNAILPDPCLCPGTMVRGGPPWRLRHIAVNCTLCDASQPPQPPGKDGACLSNMQHQLQGCLMGLWPHGWLMSALACRLALKGAASHGTRLGPTCAGGGRTHACPFE